MYKLLAKLTARYALPNVHPAVSLLQQSRDEMEMRARIQASLSQARAMQEETAREENIKLVKEEVEVKISQAIWDSEHGGLRLPRVGSFLEKYGPKLMGFAAAVATPSRSRLVRLRTAVIVDQMAEKILVPFGRKLAEGFPEGFPDTTEMAVLDRAFPEFARLNDSDKQFVLSKPPFADPTAKSGSGQSGT